LYAHETGCSKKPSSLEHPVWDVVSPKLCDLCYPPCHLFHFATSKQKYTRAGFYGSTDTAVLLRVSLEMTIARGRAVAAPPSAVSTPAVTSSAIIV